MERQGWRFVLAGFLILLGIVALLNNLNLLPWDINTMQWFWLLVFGGAGVSFLAVYVSGRENNWWALIPGLTLVGLAVLISNILPQGSIAAGVFLGSIGLSFWLIYAQKREFWWAIIPGGVLASLALMLFFTDYVSGTGEPAILFLGMGLTFLLVYLLPNPEGRMRWALWPASILGFMGLMFTIGSGGLAAYIFPAALIIGGGWIVVRSMKRKNESL